MLKSELERKIKECQKMADELLEKERRKMEEKIFQQQQEVEMLRRRLEEIESELSTSRTENASSSADIEESSFIERLLLVGSEDSEMVKSMDLDKSLDMGIIKCDGVVHRAETNSITAIAGYSDMSNLNEDLSNFNNKTFLSTVYEEEEEEEQEENEENLLDEEVQKEVIEEKKIYPSTLVSPEFSSHNPEKFDYFKDTVELGGFEPYSEPQNANNAACSRQTRIQNIFTLCGDPREHSQHKPPTSATKKLEDINSLSSSPLKSVGQQLGKIRGYAEIGKDSKENHNPLDDDETSGDVEVYVKWEASKEHAGKFITTLKVLKDSTLADLRKLIEIHLGEEEQAFTFLVLREDPSSSLVSGEKEAATQTSKLPICNNQLLHGHVACLRPVKPIQCWSHLPFSPLENKLSAATPISNFSQQGIGSL
ncbi:P-loop containing nucleoside triphosphate hydrolase superfamily protein [Abeliophyllum distichum]|uniref:P-loop containing nucleoside triphosphate hydrolase superfamily protein n=1 Tax=Abeliophyllum distichum TaxID=126358 RepID=A0ABD1REG6_9LAMI